MRGSAGSGIVTVSFLALALRRARMFSKGAGKSLAEAAPTWVRLTRAQGAKGAPPWGRGICGVAVRAPAPTSNRFLVRAPARARVLL